MTSVELIFDGALNTRAKRILSAYRAAAPSYVRASSHYTGTAPVVVVYGPGHPARQVYLRRHLSQPGHRAVLLDMAYWDRTNSLRMSVDRLHPSFSDIYASPAQPRFPIVLREDAKPTGPVMLVGMGQKSLTALGIQGLKWETDALRRIHARWPGVRVMYRPKGPPLPLPLPGCTLSHGDPIADALRGMRAVVCRHSNVAVDACVAGVPVLCEDGAAAALYSRTFEPTRLQRADFLARLSWWEWSADQAPGFWSMVERVLA